MTNELSNMFVSKAPKKQMKKKNIHLPHEPMRQPYLHLSPESVIWLEIPSISSGDCSF